MKLRIILTTALLVLAIAPAARAASSTSDNYADDAGVAQQTINDPRASDNGSSLPFTGYDALAVGGAGLLLAAVGFGLRGVARRDAAA